jgi:hypothetical protein
VTRLFALSRALALGLAATVGVLAVGGACTSKPSAVGPGGECFLATDCAPGLICVEQPDKTRSCSDDLSRVAGRSPPEAGAGEGDAANDGSLDGALSDGTTPRPDSGLPDTGTPDTGTDPVDSGED